MDGAICGSACTRRRQYSPFNDTVRWCADCAVWYHTVCCHPLKRESTTVEKPGYLQWTGDSKDRQDAVWAKLLHLPIQRRPFANVPLSFEIVISAARDAHKAAGGARPETIGDVWGWVEVVIGVPKTSRKEFENAMMKLREEVDEEHCRLRCPRCHQEM